MTGLAVVRGHWMVGGFTRRLALAIVTTRAKTGRRALTVVKRGD